MRVLVIPEDFRKDQYVLKPIVEAMMKQCGRPRAIVRVCDDPLLGSIDQALNGERIRDILERYPMVDLFLLCVDRDGNDHRQEALDNIERQAQTILSSDQRLFAVQARQELEVWLLAGHDLPEGWKWNDIRGERDPKENYYEPFAEQRGVLDELGGGRKPLAQEAVRRYDRIRLLCDEIAALEERIRRWIEDKQ